MRNSRRLLLLLFVWEILPAQIRINYEEQQTGLIHLADSVDISKINSGYTLWLPEKGSAEGLVVFFHSRRDSLPEPITELALGHNLAIVYLTSANPVEFLFGITERLQLENYIDHILRTYSIPADKMLYCGMSLAGTRALIMAQFASADPSILRQKPRAIAICDSPLDMFRFYRETRKAASLNYHPAAANEGHWVSSYLKSNLDGEPRENPLRYAAYSPYSYPDVPADKISSLTDIAIRAYHEPDVNWWMDTRRKDYYAMNSVDLAALINQLNIAGNSEAELITTRGKGLLPNGRRHPHSWNIVDETELIEWFSELIKN